MKLVLAATAAACTLALAGAAQAKPLACNQTKPVVYNIGGIDWDLYGCQDFHSVELVAPPDSDAAGAIFAFRWDKNAGYHLIGKAGPNRAAADAAYRQLAAFDSDRIAYLYYQSRSHQAFKLEKLVAGGETSPAPQPEPPAFYDNGAPLAH